MTTTDVLAVTSTGEAVTFWILGPLALLAAIMMVLSRNAVHAALFLAAVMLSLAGLYAAQDAPFLAAVQVIVYTGAILMLFLFVLMLVGVDSSDSLIETLRFHRVAAVVVALAFAVTSALLITAALGAMVLAHKERTEPKVTQREMARMRFTGQRPLSLPGPGVFAGTNSTATPALLPDGSEAETSVSPVLERRSAQQHEAASATPVAKAVPSTSRDRSEVEG